MVENHRVTRGIPDEVNVGQVKNLLHSAGFNHPTYSHEMTSIQPTYQPGYGVTCLTEWKNIYLNWISQFLGDKPGRRGLARRLGRYVSVPYDQRRSPRDEDPGYIA